MNIRFIVIPMEMASEIIGGYYLEGVNIYFFDITTDSRKRMQFERVYILIPRMTWTK